MTSATEKKTYHVRNSERCFRFKPEAFFNHAPDRHGIYELVTFDDNQNAKVLFVGAAFEKSIKESLESHAEGTLKPVASDILSKYPNLYFDFLDQTDAKSREDAQDIYWWLVNKHKPAYNDVSAVVPSGRYQSIDVIEE
jgi:hypothetical protein